MRLWPPFLYTSNILSHAVLKIFSASSMVRSPAMSGPPWTQYTSLIAPLIEVAMSSSPAAATALLAVGAGRRGVAWLDVAGAVCGFWQLQTIAAMAHQAAAIA